MNFGLFLDFFDIRFYNEPARYAAVDGRYGMDEHQLVRLDRSFIFERSTGAENKCNIHYHNNFEIYYLLEGTCWYFIDKRSYRLTAGDIALIPPGVIHKTNYETSSHARILINCSENFLPPSVIDLIPKMPYYPGSAESRESVDRIFDAIRNEYTHPDGFSSDVIKGKLYELLLFLAKKNMTGELRADNRPVVEQAVKYIRNNYMNDITLSQTAKYCFVSSEHLSRTFKKETGFGFKEYLTVYRLKKADLLLKSNTKSKIYEIALRCGFNDSNYFSKVYKKTYRVSPSQTQKNAKNGILKNDI